MGVGSGVGGGGGGGVRVVFSPSFIMQYLVSFILSCQPRVTVISCFVYKFIRSL